MSEIVEAMARVLYERERERSLQSKDWNEVADIYRKDAESVFQAACDAIGWPQIHAYREELRRGQDIYEDAGGFIKRAICALLGKPRLDPVVSYQEAARALLRETAS